MLKFTVDGQKLELLGDPFVVADSFDFLTGSFKFYSGYDWDLTEKHVFFQLGEATPYEVTLTDDEFVKTDHVNLTTGAWDIHVVGYDIDGATLIERITTNKVNLTVDASGVPEGEPFPPSIIPDVLIVKDQTVPQTFVGGIPKLAADRVIDLDNELADKKYVDDTVATVTADDFNHNDIDGLQGGSSLERYHMTQVQNAALHSHANKTALDAVAGVNTGDQSASSFNHNDLANKQGGTTNEFYHVTAAEKTVISNTSGTNTGDQVLPTRDSLGLDTDDNVTFANLSGTNTGDQDVSGAISTHNTDAGAHEFLLNRVNGLQSAITVTNLLSDGNFESPALWTFMLADGTVANNEAIFTPTANFGQMNSAPSLQMIAGKTYYYRANVKTQAKVARLYVARSTNGDLMAPAITHSGSGNWSVLEGVFIASESTNVILRVYNPAISGLVPIEVKEAMLTCLTDEFGAGNEPSLNDYKGYIYTYNNGSYFVKNNINIYVTISMAYKPKLFINVAADVVNVISKYNNQNDLRIVLSKKGPNSIFDIAYMYKIANTSQNVATGILDGTLFFTNGTDTFGPYVVAATANINGDTPSSSGFTGGNHGYNGDATGSATGRTYSIKYFVDGRNVTSFNGYAASLEIEWINYIQAYNTKKADGTGREVLKERYRLFYDGYQMAVRNTIETLEECVISTYYGAQLSVTPWSAYTLFQSSPNKIWYAGNVSCDAGAKTCDVISHKTSPDNAEVELDLKNGLGNGALLSGTKNAFRANYNKAYFFLIDSANTFVAGTILTWRSIYRFFSD